MRNIYQDVKYFEVSDRGHTVDFDLNADGSFTIDIDSQSREIFTLQPDEFQKFKKWIANLP